MMRVICLFALFYFSTIVVFAQTKEELERQRLQLKKEIDDAQKLLNSNKAATKENLTTLGILNTKAGLQEKVVITVTKDLNLLDNNIVGIQRDINKYDRLLDTLRQEYSKSMVYAYKNRGNYEFLNFIFSADNFNDAVKRIAYLKSYRTFREMQGQNIIRTQDLRRKRLEDLGITKQAKSSTLLVQTVEMKKLEEQKAEQDRIVANLKKQGKDINARIAERERQVAKINASIKAAIAKALREEKERARLAEIAAKKKRDELKAAEDKIARDKKNAEDKAARDKRAAAIAAGKTPEPEIVKPVVTTKTVKVTKVPEPVDISTESVTLNESLERNKGILPWPVDNPSILYHYGPNQFQSGSKFVNDAVTIAAQIGTTVKSVFQGTVIMVFEPAEEGKYVVMVKNGSYFFSYVNLSNVTVKVNDEIKTGQTLGRVAPNLDGIGAIDLKAAKGNTDLNPEKWLRSR
jgi:septal ring factor EnvC (AmiA/AmiB activator)